MNEQAVRDEAKRIHHEDVPWHECPWCVKFYRDDENGAAENARLTAKLHAQDLTLENVRSDIGLLLEALGKPNVARPISAHEVMLECIEAVKNLRAHIAAEASDRMGALRSEREIAASVVDGDTCAGACDHFACEMLNKFAAVIRRDPEYFASRHEATEATKDAVEQERTRIVNLLCDRCRAGEPVVERRLPNMGLGHTLPGIPHPGWARCYAEEIHADLRSRSTTPAQSLYGPIDDPQYAIDPPSESPSLTRLKAAAADLDAVVKEGAMCQANLGTLDLGCRKPLRHDGQHEGECAGYLITWGESRKG